MDIAIDGMGENGEKVKEEMSNYEAARLKVAGMVPEEHIAHYAGLVEKQDAIAKKINDLSEQKKNLHTTLHGKIDEPDK